jgi:hypothetical protein
VQPKFWKDDLSMMDRIAYARSGSPCIVDLPPDSIVYCWRDGHAFTSEISISSHLTLRATQQFGVDQNITN